MDHHVLKVAGTTSATALAFAADGMDAIGMLTTAMIAPRRIGVRICGPTGHHADVWLLPAAARALGRWLLDEGTRA